MNILPLQLYLSTATIAVFYKKWCDFLSSEWKPACPPANPA